MQEFLQDRHELKTTFFLINEELKFYKWELQKHGAGKCVVPPLVAQLRSKRHSLKAKMLDCPKETLSSSNEDEVDGQKTHHNFTEYPGCSRGSKGTIRKSKSR